jgi:hypothetical protein
MKKEAWRIFRDLGNNEVIGEGADAIKAYAHGCGRDHGVETAGKIKVFW